MFFLHVIEKKWNLVVPRGKGIKFPINFHDFQCSQKLLVNHPLIHYLWYLGHFLELWCNISAIIQSINPLFSLLGVNQGHLPIYLPTSLSFCICLLCACFALFWDEWCQKSINSGLDSNCASPAHLRILDFWYRWMWNRKKKNKINM